MENALVLMFLVYKGNFLNQFIETDQETGIVPKNLWSGDRKFAHK